MREIPSVPMAAADRGAALRVQRAGAWLRHGPHRLGQRGQLVGAPFGAVAHARGTELHSVGRGGLGARATMPFAFARIVARLTTDHRSRLLPLTCLNCLFDVVRDIHGT